MDKTIELHLTDYVMSGRATILCWDDCIGTIQMTTIHIPSLNEVDIIPNINDGGFGCKKILSADVDLFENYEGHLVFVDSRNYNLED